MGSGGAFSGAPVACFTAGCRRKRGPGNRPIAPTGGGPCLRAAPPTYRPISGRRRNLRFPGTFWGKSGNRDFGISSGIHMGGGLLDSGGAYSDVSVARFRGGFRRKRGPKIDRLRRPAGVRIRESPRPQIARFRADAKICDSRGHRRGNPEIGISGSRQEFMGGPIRFRRRVFRRLRRAF